MMTGASPRNACDAVLQDAKQIFAQASARPWDRYHPEESAWWLIPSREWPAYRHAKFFFDRDPGKLANLQIGLYIEKGLSPRVREAYPSARGSRLIMDSGWAWSGVVSNEALARLTESVTGERATAIRVEAQNVPDPESFDPYGLRFTRSRATFEVTGTNLLGDVDDAPGHLHPIHSAATMEELITGLRLLSEDPWLWIDLFVYRSYKVSQGESAEVGLLAWREHLCGLSGWLGR
jgi:hypothetical protein